ncbi:MAG: hypothetical protein ACYC27_00815 [Armatimonadota bacterium]
MEKLYSVKSTLNNFEGHDNVSIYWCAERQEPVGSFEEIIANYDNCHGFERLVNQHLTGNEVQALYRYLKIKYDNVPEISEEILPIYYDDDCMGVSFEETQDAIGIYDTIIIYSAETGLPINLIGYFDLTGCPVTIELHREYETASIRFCSILFAELGIALPDGLVDVLRDIYDDTGLCIQYIDVPTECFGYSLYRMQSYNEIDCTIFATHLLIKLGIPITEELRCFLAYIVMKYSPTIMYGLPLTERLALIGCPDEL